MRIALFITCLAETFTPRAGAAAVLVLEHLGHEVLFPRDQTCCGQPMFNTGFHPEARRLAERWVRLFEPFEAVVTPSGSCAAMVRLQYPRLFAGDPVWSERAERLAGRTREFVEFLTRVLRFDPATAGVRWEGTAAVHAPCHLRELGLLGEAEAVLRRVSGMELRTPDAADECCGFGGAFSIKHPALSGRMARDKAGALAATGAAAIVCGDAGCAMNIAGACRVAGSRQRVISPAEVIAEGLGLLPREFV